MLKQIQEYITLIISLDISRIVEATSGTLIKLCIIRITSVDFSREPATLRVAELKKDIKIETSSQK